MLSTVIQRLSHQDSEEILDYFKMRSHFFFEHRGTMLSEDQSLALRTTVLSLRTAVDTILGCVTSYEAF